MKASEMKQAAERLKYNGRIYYLYDGTIYDARMNVFIEQAANGFLDLYEYFEYFPQNKGNRLKQGRK